MISDFGAQFSIFCFTDIENAEEILQHIKENQPPVCLLDAETIISTKQIEVAVLNALGFEAQGKREAKTIYLEILRCLSPDARLAGAFKHIALSKTTKNVIAVTLEEQMPEIPGLDKPTAIDKFFEIVKPNFGLVNKIFQINEEMLKLYSYEQIVTTTLAVAASNLIRTKSL